MEVIYTYIRIKKFLSSVEIESNKMSSSRFKYDYFKFKKLIKKDMLSIWKERHKIYSDYKLEGDWHNNLYLIAQLK